MSTFLAIKALLENSVSKKAIARKLGIDPRTVRKYAKRIAQGQTEPICQRPPSKLQPFQDMIEQKVVQGLSYAQIYLDLKAAHPDFDVSYETVKRFARRFKSQDPKVYQRMTFAPGEEAQIDFGEIGRFQIDGRSRRVYLFAMTLCYSRYSYYELTLSQSVPSFLGLIRRAFEDFGGVPERIKPDNLKSAVLLNKLNERYYQTDFFKFCKHYGTQPDAARPRTPTDKGRVERDIRYVKGNCFRARPFKSFQQAQEQLADWRQKVALERIHGTTRRKPRELFAEEQKALRELPEDPYELAEWSQYKVRKDCHIKVKGSFYSVPYKYVGQKVLARLTQESLRIYADDNPVAEHPRASTPGSEVTNPEHYPKQKRLSSHEIHRQRIRTIRDSGPYACEFLSRLKSGPLVFGPQVARLNELICNHGTHAVDLACRRALYFDACEGVNLLKNILSKGLQKEPLPNEEASKRPVLTFVYQRSLADYAVLLQGGLDR